MIKVKKKLIPIFLLILSFILIQTVHAAKYGVTDAPGILDEVSGRAGVEQTDVASMAGQMVSVALGLVGTIFFVLMVYSGFLWMTARGEEEQVTKARKSIIAAIIGLVLTVAAYAITLLIMGGFMQGATPSGSTDTGNLGDDALGCCLDHYRTGGADFDGGLTSQEDWGARITTYSSCEALGNNDPADEINGPGTWEFFEGRDQVWCTEEAESR